MTKSGTISVVVVNAVVSSILVAVSVTVKLGTIIVVMDVEVVVSPGMV